MFLVLCNFSFQWWKKGLVIGYYRGGDNILYTSSKGVARQVLLYEHHPTVSVPLRKASRKDF